MAPSTRLCCVLTLELEHFIHLAADVNFRGGSGEEVPGTYFSLLVVYKRLVHLIICGSLDLILKIHQMLA